MALFALIDCNDFYASCERVFNPKLLGRPVVVLSNNDGCVIARSKEAKVLNIPMGCPVFKIQGLIRQHNIAVLSANFALYGDMSARVMSLLQAAWPEVYVYSIDEAFLTLTGLPEQDYPLWCQTTRRAVEKSTGIPLSLGLAPTKVLAKLACRMAKKQARSGVFYWHKPEVCQKILQQTVVGDLWGVGKAWQAKLEAMGIDSAWELMCADPIIFREKFNRLMQSIILELRGQSSIHFDELSAPQSISVSRSFSSPLSLLCEIEQAIASFANSAGQKARRYALAARSMNVFLSKDPFTTKHDVVRRANFSFDTPINDSATLITQSKKIMAQLFVTGNAYKKAGIILQPLVSANRPQQYDLFSASSNDESDHKARNRLVDKINSRYGHHTIFPAAIGIKAIWQPIPQNRSPAYTTNWDELPKVSCDPVIFSLGKMSE